MDQLSFNDSFLEIRKNTLPAPEVIVKHNNLNSVHFAALAAVPSIRNDSYPPEYFNLKVENLHSLSSTVDGTDIAQKAAEEYFNQNVIYQLTQSQRVDLLGIKDRPIIPNERLKIMTSHPHDVAWYQEFIKCWLPKVLSQEKSIKESGKFKVNDKIIEADLTYQCTKASYLRQTKLLYHYAYVEKVATFGNYLNDSKRWTKEYVDYLTTDEFMDAWIQINKFSPDAVVKIQNREIISKLDILDPTTKSSQEVIGKLNMAVILSKVYDNIDDIRKHDLFRSAVKKILDDILTSVGESEIKSIAQNMNNNIQNGVEFLPILLNAFASLSKGELQIPTLIGETIWQRIKSAFTLNSISTFFSRENNLLMAKRFLGLMFFGGASIAFLLGALNFENLDTFGKIQFGFNTAALFSSVLIGFTNNFLTRLASRFGKWMFTAVAPRLSIPIAVIGNMKSIIRTVFTSEVSTFLSRRCLPFLVLVSASTIVQDIIHDVGEGNVGAVVMDSLALIATIGEALLLFSAASWAGPAGVLLAVLSVAFILIKFFFFPEKTPAEKYYDHIPERYKLTSITLSEPEFISPRVDINIVGGDVNHRFISPKSDFKFHPDQYAYERSPFKLTKIGKSCITLSNAFPGYGSYNKTRFLERNTHDSSLTHNEGPTPHQVFYLVSVPHHSKQYKLMNIDAYFLTVSGSNIKFDKSSDHATIIEFNELQDWHDTSSTWSLPSTSKLGMNHAIINRECGLGLVESGLYNFPSAGFEQNKNVKEFIEAHKITTHPVMTFENVPKTSPVEFLQINEAGILKAYDKNGNEVSQVTIHYQLGTDFSRANSIPPYSLVFSRNPKELWLAVVDSNYLELSLRTYQIA